MKEIYLAGGCFWGVEEYFSRIPGVLKTKVGYANGNTKNPTYEEVCTGLTNHAETIYVKYDSDNLNLDTILSYFFKIIDPTVLNRQGPDIGTQYRTGIYYVDDSDRAVIDNFISHRQKDYKEKIVTEVEKLKVFYDGEEYHQDYLKKNPGGYCHINLDI